MDSSRAWLTIVADKNDDDDGEDDFSDDEHLDGLRADRLTHRHVRR